MDHTRAAGSLRAPVRSLNAAREVDVESLGRRPFGLLLRPAPTHGRPTGDAGPHREHLLVVRALLPHHLVAGRVPNRAWASSWRRDL